MVEHPCAPERSGRSSQVVAFAKVFVADGPMDPKLLALYRQTADARAKAEAAAAATDWPDLCLYQSADEALAQAGGAKVVFLGDSITELWQFGDPGLFTAGVVDRGVSGQTSGQALLRTYQDVVALHPKVVHIMIGANDVAGNTGPNRPEDFKNNLRAMVDIAKAHGIKVVVGSILPIAVVGWIEQYAREEGLTYVDYYSAVVGPDGGMREGYSRDGVHPLTKAYRFMRPLAEAGIAEALQLAR
jgi:lysophospholipase L1-like esterase